MLIPMRKILKIKRFDVFVFQFMSRKVQFITVEKHSTFGPQKVLNDDKNNSVKSTLVNYLGLIQKSPF